MFGKKDVLQVATHTPSASAQRALLDLPSPYNLFALAPIHGLVRNPHLDPEIWDEIYHDDKACEYGSMKYLLHNAPDDDRAMLITEQGALTRWDTLEMGIPNLSAAGWQRFINQAVFTELRFDTYNAACCIISGNLAPDLALSLWQEIAKDASSESLYKNSPASYAAAFATLAMSYDLLTDAQVASEFTTRPPFSQVHNEFLTPKTAQMLIKRPGVLALLSHTANAEFFTRNLTEFTQTSTSTPAPQLLSAQYVTTELTPALDALGPNAWRLYLQLLPIWRYDRDALLQQIRILTPSLDALGPTAWHIYLQLLPDWKEDAGALLQATRALAA